jgi:hypothetical protein
MPVAGRFPAPSVVAVVLTTSRPADPVKVMTTAADGAKPAPVTVTGVLTPATLVEGVTTRAGVEMLKAPSEDVSAPVDCTIMGSVASAATVNVAVKAPVASAVTVGTVVEPPPARNIVVIVSKGAKPTPCRVTTVPFGPLDGMSTSGAAGAANWLAADAVVARGAANEVGRLLRSSAAVSRHALMLLRSESTAVLLDEITRSSGSRHLFEQVRSARDSQASGCRW